MAVRLFIGNLAFGATEADLRAHFAPIAEPSFITLPVDRETGRPRGFAFIEFVDRAVAEDVIRKFDAQPFQGRNLAISEARARGDRPPPRPTGGGFGGPRPSGGAFAGGGRGFGSTPVGSGFSGSRDRSANFGPPAPPRRLRGSKRTQQQDNKPRGPIKEKASGRFYNVDDAEDDTAIDIDNVATRAPESGADDVAADKVTPDSGATPAQGDKTDDQE